MCSPYKQALNMLSIIIVWGSGPDIIALKHATYINLRYITLNMSGPQAPSLFSTTQDWNILKPSYLCHQWGPLWMKKALEGQWRNSGKEATCFHLGSVKVLGFSCQWASERETTKLIEFLPCPSYLDDCMNLWMVPWIPIISIWSIWTCLSCFAISQEYCFVFSLMRDE